MEGKRILLMEGLESWELGCRAVLGYGGVTCLVHVGTDLQSDTFLLFSSEGNSSLRIYRIWVKFSFSLRFVDFLLFCQLVSFFI